MEAISMILGTLGACLLFICTVGGAITLTEWLQDYYWSSGAIWLFWTTIALAMIGVSYWLP